MGNSQSTGHHNKLSKPKTNTNSPVPAQTSPASVSSRYADLSARDRQLLKTHLTSPLETDFGSPRHSSDDDGIGDLASRVQVRLNLSRSNSIASQQGSGRNSRSRLGSLPGSKLSLASNRNSTPQPVDIDTALKLIQEVRKTASPDDLAALRK
jgi:hypothetical protein